MARVAPSERFRAELDEALAGVGQGQDPVETIGRLGARLILRQALEDEVSEFLGRGRYERMGEPVAYRNGLKGFEPSTFCMASSTRTSRPAPNNAANKPFSAPARARRSAWHSPGNHGGFRTQTGPSLVVPKALGVAKSAHRRRPRVPSSSRSRSLQRRSC
jgi:hypothetical protein